MIPMTDFEKNHIEKRNRKVERPIVRFYLQRLIDEDVPLSVPVEDVLAIFNRYGYAESPLWHPAEDHVSRLTIARYFMVGFRHGQCDCHPRVTALG